MAYYSWLGIGGITLYLLATLVFVFMRNAAVHKSLGLALGVAGLLAHGTVLWELVIRHWVNLGFFHALSFVSACVVASVFLSCVWSRVRNLLVFTLPLAALFLGLEILNPLAISRPPNAILDTHILLSILAYSFLSVGALFAMLLLAQNYLLRHKHLGRELDSFPPLTQTENMMFILIVLGFVMLTLALISGFWFLEDMFAQHLAHKTLLSILAWAIFCWVLLGRVVQGRRGKRAAKLVIVGFVLVMVGYFGSKLVLELLLGG
jgi:ABC-type uncharacterized transport system permease subunit